MIARRAITAVRRAAWARAPQLASARALSDEPREAMEYDVVIVGAGARACAAGTIDVGARVSKKKTFRLPRKRADGCASPGIVPDGCSRNSSFHPRMITHTTTTTYLVYAEI